MSVSLLTRPLLRPSSRSFSHKVTTLCGFSPLAPFASVSFVGRRKVRQSQSASSSSSSSSLPSSSSLSSASLVRLNSTLPGNGPVRPVERPVSPHVTIYQFPLAAISSITNRVTGVALTVGVTGAGLVALFGGCDIPSYTAALHHHAPLLVPVFKLTFSFPLVYHSLAGLRHLYWDATAKALDLKSVDLSSQVLFGTSSIIAIILAFSSI